MSTMVRRIACAAIVAVVAGISLAAWPAAAKGPADGLPAGPALRFDPKFCNAQEQAAVTEAFAMARQRAAQALQVATANPNDRRMIQWFGQGQQRRVVQVLQAVVRQLGAPNITITCARTSYCQQRQPMAYTDRAQRIMGFCAGFFRAALTGEDSRFGAVIHEMTHLAAGTQDHVYSRPAARTLALKQAERAANNADSYEYFCETLDD
jgi:peptidyl-Lys metalloendopeptidase